MLAMELEDEGQDVELSLDLIEVPYYLLFTSGERARTVRAFSPGGPISTRTTGSRPAS